MIDDLIRPIDYADHLLYRSEVRTGIRARTYLPLPQYDHLFELREINGKTLCVMKPGTLDYDKHYWEEVPLP